MRFTPKWVLTIKYKMPNIRVMVYSRKYLKTLNKNAPIEEVQKVTNDLLQRIHDDQPLSMAERHWICPFMEIIKSSEDNKALDPFDFPGCKEALFRDRYLYYTNNVNGWRPARDFFGEIPPERMARDLELLEKEGRDWESKIKVTNHSDSILKFTSKEVRDQLKAITNYCKDVYGYNREKNLQKMYLLHSKYMYYMVCEYYEEYDSEIEIELDREKLYIDAFAYIHILSRHFAQNVKEHLSDKSYHDNRIDHQNLPDQLFDIIVNYKSIKPKSFDKRKIYFKMGNDVFVIWLKTDKGTQPHRLRVNSFYPVTDPTELKAIENYSNLVKSGDYEFYD